MPRRKTRLETRIAAFQQKLKTLLAQHRAESARFKADGKRNQERVAKREFDRETAQFMNQQYEVMQKQQAEQEVIDFMNNYAG